MLYYIFVGYFLLISFLPPGVADKSLLTSSTIAAYQTRVVLRNRLVIINKLVADLNFWNEIQKYTYSRCPSYTGGGNKFWAFFFFLFQQVVKTRDVPVKMHVCFVNKFCLLWCWGNFFLFQQLAWIQVCFNWCQVQHRLSCQKHFKTLS